MNVSVIVTIKSRIPLENIKDAILRYSATRSSEKLYIINVYTEEAKFDEATFKIEYHKYYSISYFIEKELDQVIAAEMNHLVKVLQQYTPDPIQMSVKPVFRAHQFECNIFIEPSGEIERDAALEAAKLKMEVHPPYFNDQPREHDCDINGVPLEFRTRIK